MNGAMETETITLSVANEEKIEAYVARTKSENRRGGVVVIHHLPGFDRATREIVRRFAELGYDAICPNLHWREAPGGSADEGSAAVRAKGGVPDDRLLSDVDGAMTYLRDLPDSNGRVGVIGYCSGGRQAVLAACNLDLDAAVDCYGAYVTGTPPEGFPIRTNIEEHLENLRCKLLGLFGNLDQHPSPEHVDRLIQLLEEYGKDFEVHRYDEAAHAFFAVDKESYVVSAANDGWDRIADFFKRTLDSDGS